MIIDEIQFELKDGRRALLRSPKEEDIAGTLEYLVISAGETDFILPSVAVKPLALAMGI